ncbi:hypothetical protein CO058_03840 [candidate division WWE3 bacterium CG_4_9_14_0_2_um_filter_35_11]|uniref:Transcriptional regulator, AbiEi antitoxin, Type IV TA system n=1 Tax=candidate division WWE3 bacterium CG_4_9_14_0_2_um_filter_35_11 TaxID=1975077 RepID=A0A2M8EKW1_UNCKA|nr:MAG: hypothetical protein CO058_03840 [candidate division WWE3 bacterium CG_4_9_14_0_2_um_filter_35_11]
MSLSKDLLKNKPVNKTVFSTNEIGQILNSNNKQNSYSALNYATQKGDLIRITRGIYSFNKNYSELELGNKLRKPSYVSLYTILQSEGIVFQYYKSTYLIAKRTDEINIGNQKYIYRKLKDSILLNPLGLVTENSTIKATVERALCDKIYLDGDEYFDNVRKVNWKLMSELNEKLYKDKRIMKFISKNKNAII